MALTVTLLLLMAFQVTENLAMLLAWAYAAYLLSLFLRCVTKKDKRKQALLYALLLAVIIVSGVVLGTAINAL